MQAIILAGGEGKRLYPLTRNTPKPMLMICGKPILHHQIEMLQRSGVNEIVIMAGYRGEKVHDYFSAPKFRNAHINVLIEEEPLGTAGAKRLAIERMDPTADPVLLSAGDVLFNFDLQKIAIDHQKSGAVLTTILVPMRSPYGLMEFDTKRRVKAFRGKPHLPYPVMSGVYVASRAVLKYLPRRGDMKDTLPRMVKDKVLYAYLTRHYWRSVETLKDLEEITSDVQKGYLLKSRNLYPPLPNYASLIFED